MSDRNPSGRPTPATRTGFAVRHLGAPRLQLGRGRAQAGQQRPGRRQQLLGNAGRCQLLHGERHRAKGPSRECRLAQLATAEAAPSLDLLSGALQPLRIKVQATEMRRGGQAA